MPFGRRYFCVTAEAFLKNIKKKEKSFEKRFEKMYKKIEKRILEKFKKIMKIMGVEQNKR